MRRHILRVNANLQILRISLQRYQKPKVRSHGCSGTLYFIIMEQDSSSNTAPHLKILMKSYIEFEFTKKHRQENKTGLFGK